MSKNNTPTHAATPATTHAANQTARHETSKSRTHEGLFVALEGVDGAGKSTQVKRLKAALEARGLSVAVTFEPTNGEFGQRIRNATRPGATAMSAHDELHLFVSDRREHVTWLADALTQHDVVITDRYFFSTAAYQGAAGLDPADIYKLHAGWCPVPAMTFVLDLDPEESLHRIQQKRGATPDTFETLDRLTRVRDIFRAIPTRFPHLIVDAARDEAAVTETMLAALAPLVEPLRGDVARR